jgi:predicted DNA-binding protein (UPF0278 family)
VETLEKQVKEVRERLNFGKRRKEKEITREEAEMLGMRYGAGEKIAKGWMARIDKEEDRNYNYLRKRQKKRLSIFNGYQQPLFPYLSLL